MNNLLWKPPYMAVVNGKQGSGKSHFLKWLMREHNLDEKRKFDFGVVFSNTAFEGSFDYIPKKYVFEGFDISVVEALMKIQKNNIKKKIQKQAFIILDDCLDDENQWNSPAMKKLSTQLRHYNITLIITTQYPHCVPPQFRSNAMYSAFFDVGPGRRELQATYDCYGGRFKSYEIFKQYYFANIKDHKFITYDRERDEYQTYRAPEKIPKFSIKYNKNI